MPARAQHDEAEIEESQEAISEWYTRVIVEAQLADFTAVRGSIAIRPYGYAIWELIQAYVDRELKATGHKNASFPSLIPMSLVEKEASHVEGFAPELAVVTHGGGEKLAEPLVVRPTSETIIYDLFRRWISSYRDLPVLINQWGNAVRWERRTRLFLRGTEFLWNEGHTVHGTFERADAEARMILKMYARFLEGELAIPVLAGMKTERERFAGALTTYTLESLMRDGRALQMVTCHHLGQNFSRAFDVKFLDRDGQEKHPWSTSWAVSTRVIGALVLVHGDEQGLILPPRVAPIQVVIVPIWRAAEQRAALEPYVTTIQQSLRSAGMRVESDWRETVRPGFKFNDWELRGVPVRLEVGPRDLRAGQVVAVRRDTRTKTVVAVTELAERCRRLLEEVQTELFARATRFREDNTHTLTNMDQLRRGLEERRGFYWVLWCGKAACEDALSETGATIRLIPLEPGLCEADRSCIICGQPAAIQALVAKSY